MNSTFNTYIIGGVKTITNDHNMARSCESSFNENYERFSCPWHGNCFKCGDGYICSESDALKELRQVTV